MTIYERIKGIRLSNNLTQIEFSEQIDVNRNTLAHIELGKQLPTIDTLRKISLKFTVKYEYLIDGAGEMGRGTDQVIIRAKDSSLQGLKEKLISDLQYFGLDYRTARILREDEKFEVLLSKIVPDTLSKIQKKDSELNLRRHIKDHRAGKNVSTQNNEQNFIDLFEYINRIIKRENKFHVTLEEKFKGANQIKPEKTEKHRRQLRKAK